ncbi:amino acid ABC transporter permease [Pseudooceanicola sp.]|uniref:amino acid ABC transporter permease n=1 Tax=Pseudooceanicola sp. TaxID=1914328 RepID=UPI0040587A26|tara:strand:+ start:5987 stop:7297 length:1311 start_codon:yes stop_codon:yes gene_type:complete
MSDTHAETVAFVRDTMLPEKAPPAAHIGVVGWARINLFSGWMNTVLTIISLLFVGFVLYEILPWLISPTWDGASLTNCREILAALGDDRGACWGVIRERWPQLMFGFYPADLYWRPVLTFVLLLVAVSPVLFADYVPSKILWFSMLYPFIAVWLLWGGTIWGPISALFGFVVGFVVFRIAVRFIIPPLALTVGVLAAVLWWSVLGPALVPDLARLVPVALAPVQSREFGGFLLSITIGVTAIMASLPIGIVLALGRQSDLPLVKSICVGFIEFIRGVPLITLLFVASVLLNIFLPPGTTFDIILRVMIMVTLFASAYMAEVIRGGLAALPKGQYEGADSLGLDYWQAQRLIIMPQALKISIPGIVSTFIGVFKDTTLVSIISMFDPIGLSNAIRADTAWNGIYWELFIFIGAIFFIFCFSMSRYSMYLERKLQTGH